MEAESHKKRRRRFKQTHPLRERLMKAADAARQQAEQAPAGAKRSSLLRKAREIEAVVHLEQWQSSPDGGTVPGSRMPQTTKAIG
jgi:hypothetical protein